MELQSDRQEISVRLLQNGRYVWTIALNEHSVVTPKQLSLKVRSIDKELREVFPNHVRENSVKFQELE